MPIHYEIRVDGRLSDAIAGSPGVDAEVHPVETTLRGHVRDRVELHTLLDKLDSLGIEVLELRRSRSHDDA